MLTLKCWFLVSSNLSSSLLYSQCYCTLYSGSTAFIGRLSFTSLVTVLVCWSWPGICSWPAGGSPTPVFAFVVSPSLAVILCFFATWLRKSYSPDLLYFAIHHNLNFWIFFLYEHICGMLCYHILMLVFAALCFIVLHYGHIYVLCFSVDMNTEVTNWYNTYDI